MAKVTVNPKFQEQVQAYMDKKLQECADYVEEEARDLAPVRTGTLAASITQVKTDEGFKIGSDCKYAGYIEYGTRRIAPVAYLRRALASLLIHLKRNG